MGEARIEFTIGAVSFVGEGEKDWVAAQLDKILEKAPDLVRLAPRRQPTKTAGESSAQQQQPMQADSRIAQMTLPAFLKEKNATRNQVNKFLATAVWLEAKGKTRISTGDIASALKDSNQTRLANASDCLNKNVTKGYCEKDGKQFFVTEDGKASL